MTHDRMTARALAAHFLRDGPLDGVLSSGVFVQADSVPQAESFLHELGEILENSGLYVLKVRANEMTHSGALAMLSLQLKAICQVENEQLDLPSDVTLADTVDAIVRFKNTSIAILIEGIQVLQDEHGSRVMKALKAARDAANIRPGFKERLLLVATCTVPKEFNTFFAGPGQAFYGATTISIQYGAA